MEVRGTPNPIPWPNRVVELCLGLALLVPPFIFGAREAYGQTVLAVLVLATFGFWIAGKITNFETSKNHEPRTKNQEPRDKTFLGFGSWFLVLRSWPEVVLPLAAIGLGIVTWISLPSSLIQTLSPGIRRLLPEWTSGSLGAIRGWDTFSLTPGLSRDATLLFVLYVLLFWITWDTVRHRESIHRLLRTLFISGVGVAAVGILHYLFWNGKFYWLWDIWWVEPDRQVRAPFTNRNHFAGFLALTLGPGVAVLARLIREGRNAGYQPTAPWSHSWGLRDFKILMAAGGLTLILAGIGLSQSRGGIVVGLTVAVACIAGLFRTGLNRITGLAAAVVILSISLALVSIFGRQDPFQRTAQMLESNQSLDEISNARLQLWKSDLHAVFDFPLLGSGPGSHQYVYPLYLKKDPHFTFTHAENCYVQILVECGLAGIAILLTGIAFVVRWNWRALQRDGHEPLCSASDLSLAVAVSLLAALVHAFVDFVWYVPAYAAAMAVLIGLSRSLARRKELLALKDRILRVEDRGSSSRSKPAIPIVRRLIFSGSLIAGGAALAWMIGVHFVQAVQTEYAWNAYYRLLPASREEGQSESFDHLRERATWLAEVSQHGSADPDHYYRLGLANLELFLQHQKKATRPAGLLETRRTMQQNRRENPEATRAWLQSRYGDDLALLEKAQAALVRSLDCCPLFGSSYLHLAKISFLDASYPLDPQPYCFEAQLVRPYDPDVHMQVGLEAWLAGDRMKARESWWQACELHHPCQTRILPLLAAQMPAQEVVDFLPFDFEGLKWLAQTEMQLGRREDSRIAVEKARQAVEHDLTQAKNPEFWVALQELYQQAELRAQAEACLRKAVRLTPDRLGLHLLLIRWLMEDGQWRAALEHAQDARLQFLNQPDVQALVNDILVMKAPKTGVRDQKSEIRDQKSEVGSQRPEKRAGLD